jgi:hypothetical protein
MKVLDFASLYELSNMEYIDYNSTIENRYNMKVIEFLSQKFSHELIAKDFKVEKKDDNGYIEYSLNNVSIIFFIYDYDYEYHFEENESYVLPSPNTLNDFITDCKRLNIELKFKEK